MSSLTKQLVIYTGLLLVCSTYTVIAPFYPKVAEEKGLPLWLIGIVFALNPLANLIVAPFLGKYMNKIGRKQVVVASYVFTALSMFIMSPIEIVDKNTVIVLSVFSRLIGGMGAVCLFTSVITIFASDYPDRVQIMIGRMEAAIGVGLILGPLAGSALYLINLLAALLVIGGVILGFSPIAWKMLGGFREYEIKEININRWALLVKPKIILTLLMTFSFLFSMAFIYTLLEIHLSHFGMSSFFVGLCFVLQSAIFLIFSVSAGSIFKRVPENYVMLIGITLLGIAYLMMGPNEILFPNEVWVIVASLPILSTGQALVFVFGIPYMIKSAVNDYDYLNDDILTDVLSSFNVFIGSIGEIIGPIYGGFISEFIGISNCCSIVGVASLIFGAIFALGTGIVTDCCKKKTTKKSSLLINTKVTPENR